MEIIVHDFNCDYYIKSCLELEYNGFMVREIKKEELKELLKLYLYLHESSIPEMNAYTLDTWNRIL